MTVTLPHSFTAARAEVQHKSAFLNKDSVQTEVKAVLSQKATLSCELVDNATQVKWCKDGKQLSPSAALQVDSKGKLRQLVICSAEKKDAGQYTCEVGTEKLVFNLQVAGRRLFLRGDLWILDLRAWRCCLEQAKILSLHLDPTNKIWLMFGFCQTISGTAAGSYFCQIDGV